MFDKPYIVIFVCFDRWRELYAVVGWAFCAACGTGGSDYCAIERTGPMYHEDTDPSPLLPTQPSHTQEQGVSGSAANQRKRELASPASCQLPAIKVCYAMYA